MNIFKKQLEEFFPTFCVVALQSPKVLNQILFIKNIRMISYRSVLREMASLLLSGGVSAVLPCPTGLPQQSKAKL